MGVNMEENNFFNSEDSFEDIVSDTSKHIKKQGNDIEYFDTYSDSKYFKKNRHGIRKVFSIGDWWHDRKAWQKSVMVTAISLVLIFGILATIVLTVFDYNYNPITKDPEELGFTDIIDDKIINIALFGIDTRDVNSFKGLSDSIMILSLNTKIKTVKIISIMRDTLVPIELDGKTTYNKINYAYLKGGPVLAIKTLNTNFGLDISEYATVNFFGMAEIIDAVGGVDVELTKGEITGKNNINDSIDEICREMGEDPDPHKVTSAGKKHLNGIQAVAYSRIRYVANIWGTNNDHGRTDRQRHVMEQLFNKALTIEKSKYLSLAKALIPYSETSLSVGDIVSLASSILLHSPSFKQTRVPLAEYEMSGKNVPSVGSCVYYDIDYAEKIIHAFIYDDVSPEDYIKENGVEKNDWYKGPVVGGNSGSGGGSGSGSSSGGGSGTPDDDTPDNTEQPDENPDIDAEKPEEGEAPDDGSGDDDTDDGNSSDDSGGDDSSDGGSDDLGGEEA